MMPIKNLFYLLQLEDYDLRRFDEWLRDHPGKVVEEKKKKLVWTKKVKALYKIARVLAPVFGNEKAVSAAVRIISPFDWIAKKTFLIYVWIRLRMFYRHTLVIAIAGSWGKTTLKERLYEVLKTTYRVHRTKGNNNTLLGIAINALRMPRNTEIFIAEMDAWRRGDISEACSLIHPTIGVLTSIGPMHLERFGNIQDLYAANLELYDVIPKTGFVLIPKEIHESIHKRSGLKTVFFEDIDETIYEIGKSFGIDEKLMRQKIKEIVVPHRLETMRSRGMTIMDDAYNSNPVGFKKALEKLGALKAKRKILVTPGMIELGTAQFNENEKIMRDAAKICTHIIIVGETNKIALIQGIQSSRAKRVKVIEARTFEDAQAELMKIAENGSAVLFENDLPDHYF